MEALAAAASIAGVFSLTGQCIDGCVKLSGFFSDLSSASKTIDRFLHDINTLLRVLYDVEELASKIYSQTEPSFPDYYVRLLQTELEDCKKDVFKWLEIARQLRPASNRGRRAWFKKFWIAVNQRSVNNIRGDIARHKQTIELKLSLLGRNIDIHTSRKVDKVDRQIEMGRTVIASHSEVLNRIDTQSKKTMKSSEGSMRSLNSIFSSLSRIEQMAASASSPRPIRRASLPSAAPRPRSNSNVSVSRRHSRAASDGGKGTRNVNTASRPSSCRNSREIVRPSPQNLQPSKDSASGGASASSEKKSLVPPPPPRTTTPGSWRPASRTGTSSFLGPKFAPQTAPKKFACQCCGENPQIFATKAELEDHRSKKSRIGTWLKSNVPKPNPETYVCGCCSPNPRKFGTIHELFEHTFGHAFPCKYCECWFPSKTEAEDHQNQIHLRKNSWSCAALAVDYELFFMHRSHTSAGLGSCDSLDSSLDRDPEYDNCIVCGAKFKNAPVQDWAARKAHFETHKLAKCRDPRKFFRLDNFRQHINISHAGRTGWWTRVLEKACSAKEPDSSSNTLKALAPSSRKFYQLRHYQNLHQLTNDIYPTPILEYLHLRGLVSLYEGYLSLLTKKTQAGKPTQGGQEAKSTFQKISQQQRALNEHLSRLHEDLARSKALCVEAGHSLQEVDQAMQGMAGQQVSGKKSEASSKKSSGKKAGKSTARSRK